ncbi:MAG: hypothetical protein COA82_00945 [Alkaliphilus sp.]|nr:MAG: hypothetical protein COA82_00945 [Alkaliphilus sp.]
MRSEKEKLAYKNACNLVNDLFVNYYFTKNSVDLLTDSKKILKQIDENKINIKENYLKNCLKR